MIFENKMSWNTVVTIILALFGGLGLYTAMHTQNALQDARIEANQAAVEKASEFERQTRKEALQEIKLRMDVDRAEMRAQFSKLNDKIDELIKRQRS